MTTYVSRSDAVVALRSFGRRFADVLEGPSDDDAWERLVRRGSSSGQSAVQVVADAVAQLRSLAEVVPRLQTDAIPAPRSLTSFAPSDGDSLESLQDAVRSAAADAGDALDGRDDNDYDSELLVNNARVTLAAYVSGIVTRLAADTRRAAAAVSEASD
jgi:hypothetical protein